MALRSFWREGKATLTTVPSINAKLEPRIVAVRIHLPDDFGHGEGTRPDRITPSSYGSGIDLAIVVQT